MRASVREDIAADLSAAASKGRHKKKNNNRRDRNRAQAKEKSEQLKKKSRLKRTTRDDAFFADDAGLTDSEAEYFRAVERVRKHLSSRKEEESAFYAHRRFPIAPRLKLVSPCH